MVDNREILFRGKRLDNGEWVEGSLLKGTIDGKAAHLIFSGNFSLVGNDVKALSHALVDPDTVGQYVGFSDSNGKRVFEDDIVRKTFRIRGEPDFVEDQVLLWAGGAVVEFVYIQTIDGWTCDFEPTNDFRESRVIAKAEVIGNIHDNRDLIQEPEKLLE